MNAALVICALFCALGFVYFAIGAWFYRNAGDAYQRSSAQWRRCTEESKWSLRRVKEARALQSEAVDIWRELTGEDREAGR